MILVVRQELSSTLLLMDNWNKSVKTAVSSLAVYLRGKLKRPSRPEDDLNLKALMTLTPLMKFSWAVLIGRDNGSRSDALWS